MKLNELMQQLVTAETVEQRMKLVEDNPTLDDIDTEEVTRLNTKISQLELDHQAALQQEKQKYIDRFFSGNSTDNGDTPPPKEVTHKTLAELGF